MYLYSKFSSFYFSSTIQPCLFLQVLTEMKAIVVWDYFITQFSAVEFQTNKIIPELFPIELSAF